MARSRHVSAVLALVLGSVVTGCKKEELPGQYFHLNLKGAENLCTGNGTGYTDEFEYRLEVDGNDVSVAIGPDVWATGTVDGCTVSYTSLAWSDYRDDADGNSLEIQWVINGEARVNIGGGGGCVENDDWEGTEVFLITESAHPDVAAGCTYTIDTVGKWEKEVQ